MMGSHSPELADINRTLKDLSRGVDKQNRILEQINATLLLLAPKTAPTPPKPTEVDAPPPFEVNPPKTYGWSMAASAQREGLLCVNDLKIEQDESKWIWTGEIWERVEDPSVRDSE